MNRIDYWLKSKQISNPVNKLILINVVVFLIAVIVNLVSFLMLKKSHFTDLFLALPSNVSQLIMKPWTIVTYQFAHAGLLHLAFNMLLFYFIGTLFMDFYKKNEVYLVYLMGGLFGGLLFILSSFLPVFSGQLGIMVGASASVLAILFATTVYAPHIRLSLFGVFEIKLFWLALFYLILDLIMIPISNSGGHIAHIGGALFGAIYGYYKKGLFNINLNHFEVKKAPQQSFKPKVSVTQMKQKVQKVNQYSNQQPTQEEVDAILDKISKTGYDKLSKEEKDILFKASQN